jgi:glycogen operon protein
MVSQWPGAPFPLGATWDGQGTNFALFSENAEAIELCLVDGDGGETRVPVTRQTSHIWHTYLPGIQPGQRYGYRVHGPWDPGRGLLFNPAKFLLDPYAKAIDGHPATHDPRLQPLTDDGEISLSDSLPVMSPGVVIDPRFDWGDDAPPRTPWSETVIYETHDDDPPGCAGGASRHLRGDRASRGGRPSSASGCYGGGAAAGASHRG